MKKRDNILKKYLVTLALIFCAFTLIVGIAEANNKTSYMTSGTSEQTVTEKQVTDYLSNEIEYEKNTITQFAKKILTAF